MERHYKLLKRWNPVARLTSITAQDAIVDRHFLESFAALPFLDPPSGTLVDVGSGNGFPAMPLLLLRPQLRGVLLEPAARKRAYLKEVVQELGMEERVEVLALRVLRDDSLKSVGPFDYLTLRAVGRLDVIVRAAAAGLRPGGRALLFLGRSKVEVIKEQLDPQLEVQEVVSLPRRRASFLAVLRKLQKRSGVGL